MKQCSICLQCKPQDSFHGRSRKCIECFNDARRVKTDEDRQRLSEENKRRVQGYIEVNENRDPYAVGGTRLCRRCDTDLPITEFYKNKRQPNGLATYCKLCDKKRVAERRGQKLNISTEEYYELLELQEAKCAICGRDERLAIDHCHKTQVVRGLLCWHCNTSLGKFQDDPEWLEAAAAYLRKVQDI
jgi:hypothetical protein